jgi:hypothetical protein
VGDRRHCREVQQCGSAQQRDCLLQIEWSCAARIDARGCLGAVALIQVFHDRVQRFRTKESFISNSFQIDIVTRIVQMRTHDSSVS